MTPTTADLSFLTADQLAERVEPEHLEPAAAAAFAELQTRAKHHGVVMVWKARAEAAEKERDEARERYEFWHEKATEYVIQARGAEARLAETQKALEAERHRAVEAETRLIRALTTHHTEA